jgi:hypothetical protein
LNAKLRTNGSAAARKRAGRGWDAWAVFGLAGLIPVCLYGISEIYKWDSCGIYGGMGGGIGGKSHPTCNFSHMPWTGSEARVRAPLLWSEQAGER